MYQFTNEKRHLINKMNKIQKYVLELRQLKKSEVSEVIDKICLLLTNKIRKEMPDVDDERAEIINYGLHLLIGELPKNFIILGLSYILGVFKLTLLTVILLLPYRASSGGFHLKYRMYSWNNTYLLRRGKNIKLYHFQQPNFKIYNCIISLDFRNGNGPFVRTSRYRKCSYTF